MFRFGATLLVLGFLASCSPSPNSTGAVPDAGFADDAPDASAGDGGESSSSAELKLEIHALSFDQARRTLAWSASLASDDQALLSNCASATYTVVDPRGATLVSGPADFGGPTHASSGSKLLPADGADGNYSIAFQAMDSDGVEIASAEAEIAVDILVPKLSLAAENLGTAIQAGTVVPLELGVSASAQDGAVADLLVLAQSSGPSVPNLPLTLSPSLVTAGTGTLSASLDLGAITDSCTLGLRLTLSDTAKLVSSAVALEVDVARADPPGFVAAFARSSFELDPCEGDSLRPKGSAFADGVGPKGLPSRALHLLGTVGSSSIVAFTVPGGLLEQGVHPYLVVWLKGTSANSSLSIQVGASNIAYPLGTFTVEKLVSKKGAHSYTGSIDTSGNWARAILDLRGVTLPDGAQLLVKAGKAAVLDIWIDDIEWVDAIM